MKTYYIASCVFTAHYPKLSQIVQDYMRQKGFEVVRCCVPNYKLQKFIDAMPDDYRDTWGSLPDSGDFQDGDIVISLCHNCSAIIEEQKPGVHVRSLWEFIADDAAFKLPDYSGRTMVLQDCWRAFDRTAEQDAVRTLLERLHIAVEELPDNREKTDFCGISTLRKAPPRNLKLAPQRFVYNANVQGKFRICTPEEQKAAMTNYCRRFGDKEVIAYCHYCMEGLLLGGANASHLAELLFSYQEEFRF